MPILQPANVPTNFWMSGKQCRPWLDDTFCNILPGPTVFAQACLSKMVNTISKIYQIYPKFPMKFRVKGVTAEPLLIQSCQTVQMHTDPSLCLGKASVTFCHTAAHTNTVWLKEESSLYRWVSDYLDKNFFISPQKYMLWVCLCWGFTAQSTQWGHVERGQFT